MNAIAVDPVGQKFMLAFKGEKTPPGLKPWIQGRHIAGFTLFRPNNVVDPAQVRHLTHDLQQIASAVNHPPLLIAADQEGGQLVALGDQTTQFPGNMALGATRDPDLAQRVGRAIGLEMAAMGVNVNYTPDCDVNTNPANPNVGVRAFGDDPGLVAEMAVSMIRGLQSAGVAATAKHFPGNGESSIDPHFGVPVLTQDPVRLEQVEFRPFQAAIDAGVKVVMSAHVALPTLTGRTDLPATLASEIMHDLLRDKMRYKGILITDALDMKAISQGAGQIVDVIAAIRAGVDLLLLTDDPKSRDRLYRGVQLAVTRGLVSQEQLKASAERILSLKAWIAAQHQPDLEVVGCPDHQELEEEAARRSVTLVRNQAGLIPLQLKDEDRVVVIMPKPADLTPADSSSYVKPLLATALRSYHSNVEELIVNQRPTEAEIASLCLQSSQFDLIVLGTISANLQMEQASLAKAILSLGIPTVTVALRTPYDLLAYPTADTHACTYSIQPASMSALAAALLNRIPFTGRLPVSIPELHPIGHGLTLH